jgi:CubicO group peptidase (beta-lactamase class C family)
MTEVFHVAAVATSELPADRRLVNFYSAGKAIVATLVLRLVQRGLFTLDTPVADIWPEFAAGGKHVVTVRQAMCHEAAVPAIREALTDADLLDWSTMTGALAATEPWWPIGTRHAYHTNTFGHLLGELVRRTTGSLPGIELDRLAGEIGADVWIGVPEEHLDRCADVIWGRRTATAAPADSHGSMPPCSSQNASCRLSSSARRRQCSPWDRVRSSVTM